MVIRGPGGERVVNAEDYWIGPGTDITRMNVLAPNELLTAIRIPATWAGAQFYFEKVRDRQVWDFPLVNVASAIKPNGANIGEIRLVVNAVAARPRRLHNVEAAVVGKPRNEETAKLAGDLAVEGAQTLRHNGYKVPLMRNLVKRAIRGAGGHGPLNVGTESVGRVGSHPRLMESVLGVAVCRRAVLRRARQLHAVLGAPQARRQLKPTPSRPRSRTCRRRSNGTT